MKNGKIFGEIPGFPVGSTFVNRVVASEDGVHTPQMQESVVTGATERIRDRDSDDLLLPSALWHTKIHRTCSAGLAQTG